MRKEIYLSHKNRTKSLVAWKMYILFGAMIYYYYYYHPVICLVLRVIVKEFWKRKTSIVIYYYWLLNLYLRNVYGFIVTVIILITYVKCYKNEKHLIRFPWLFNVPVWIIVLKKNIDEIEQIECSKIITDCCKSEDQRNTVSILDLNLQSLNKKIDQLVTYIYILSYLLVS